MSDSHPQKNLPHLQALLPPFNESLSVDNITDILYFERAMGHTGMLHLTHLNEMDLPLFYESLPDAFVKLTDGQRSPFRGKASDFIPGLGRNRQYSPARAQHRLFLNAGKVAHTHTPIYDMLVNVYIHCLLCG